MKLAVVGSNKFSNFTVLLRILNMIKKKANYHIEEIVTQAETTKDEKDPTFIYGIGEFASKYAKTMMFPCRKFYIEWEDSEGVYNPKAALNRNEELIEYADVFVILHERDDNCMKLIDQIKKSGKNYYEFDFKKMKQTI